MDKIPRKTEQIIQSTEFFFEKGREAIKKWLYDYELSEEDKFELQKLLKDYKLFSAIEKEDKFFDIKELFFEIIAYCDEKANNKNIYNKYDDNRVLAKAYVRMNDWCNHVYNYKYNREQTSSSVFNALEMLKDPLNNINTLSVNHRNKISLYYLNKPYDKSTFVNEITTHFKEKSSLTTVNSENFNLLVTVLIYQDQKKWDVAPRDFRNYISELKSYFEEIEFPLLFGVPTKKYVWVSDEERYFHELDAHFEPIIENGEISLDLHFEGPKSKKDELVALVDDLPDFLEWKPWQTKNYAISHIKKFDLHDENLIEESASCLMELYDFAYPLFIDKLKERYPLKTINMNISDEFKEVAELLEYKNQIILKGPPGTGKTRMAEELARYIIGQQINFESDEKLVLTKEEILFYVKEGQEIPSKSGVIYTVEEILEGTIGVKSTKSKIWYPSFNNIIRSFNDKLYKEKNRSSGFKPYEDAIAMYLDSVIDKTKLNKVVASDINLEASPYFKMVQFHPSYTYEDFVRGIVSEVIDEGKGVIYEGKNKILAEYAIKALDNPHKKYILIIDEINRANLSSVLGELIFALEYRDKAVDSMYAVDDDNSLVLPTNLLIIGTMNTADRSVGHIDYAIRRRFAFVHVPPKPLVSTGDFIFDSALFYKVKEIFVNHISDDFNIEDVQLGHSYFIDKSNEKGSMKIRLKYEIIPILKEYIQDGILNESARESINELTA